MKRTPEIESRICELVANGCSYAEAAAAVGIHRDTFRVWRKTDPAFSAVIKKAEAEAVAKMVGTITKAAEKTWQAAAWWLERKYPGRYAKREPQAVSPYAVAARKWEPVPPGEWEGEAAVDLIEKMVDCGAPPELVEHAQKLRDELFERESRRDYLPYSERQHMTAVESENTTVPQRKPNPNDHAALLAELEAEGPELERMRHEVRRLAAEKAAAVASQIRPGDTKAVQAYNGLVKALRMTQEIAGLATLDHGEQIRRIRAEIQRENPGTGDDELIPPIDPEEFFNSPAPTY